MIRIALTKGRVEEQVIPRLESIGFDMIPLRDKKRKLVIPISEELEIILVKGSDVSTYVMNGVADMGIVGSDVLVEENSPVCELGNITRGQCRFILASTQDYTINRTGRQRIGTKYPRVTQEYFWRRGQDVEIIKINGSVELAPLIGLADAIVDITETGTTLRENHLVIYDELGSIDTRLVANPVALKQKRKAMLTLADGLCIDSYI